MTSKLSFAPPASQMRLVYLLVCVVFVVLFTLPLWMVLIPELSVFASTCEKMVVHPQGFVLFASPPEILKIWTGSWRGHLTDSLRVALGLFNAGVAWIMVTVVGRIFLEWSTRLFWLVVVWVVWLLGWYFVGRILLLENPVTRLSA